jgi:hypothetical protein
MKTKKGFGTVKMVLIVMILILLMVAAYIILTRGEADETYTVEGAAENATTEGTGAVAEDVPSCPYEICDYFDKCDGELIEPSPTEDKCCKGTCVPPTDEEMEIILETYG